MALWPAIGRVRTLRHWGGIMDMSMDGSPIIDKSPIDGLYAIGNTAANAFGKSYPGAGATIGQGVVFGYIAAQHAAGRL